MKNWQAWLLASGLFAIAFTLAVKNHMVSAFGYFGLQIGCLAAGFYAIVSDNDK